MTKASAAAATAAGSQSPSSLRRPSLTHTRSTSRSGQSTSPANERPHTRVHAPGRSRSRVVIWVSTLVGPGAGHHRTTRSRTDPTSMITSVARRLRGASTTDENTWIPCSSQTPGDGPRSSCSLRIPHSICNVDVVDTLHAPPSAGCPSSRRVGTLQNSHHPGSEGHSSVTTIAWEKPVGGSRLRNRNAMCPKSSRSSEVAAKPFGGK